MTEEEHKEINKKELESYYERHGLNRPQCPDCSEFLELCICDDEDED